MNWFDLLAPYYDRLFHRLDPTPLLNHLDPHPTHRLLDVGGGTGRVTQHIVSHVRHTIILDLSPSMTRQAHRKGLTAIQGQSEHLPFRTASFDRVLVVDALHHFADQERTIRELLRVLKPDGLLLIEEPDIRHPFVRLIALGERILGMQSRFRPAQAWHTLLSTQNAHVRILHPNPAIFHLIVTKPADRPNLSVQHRQGGNP